MATEIAQQIRTLPVLAEDLRWVPRTHIRELTAACNASYKGCSVLFSTSWVHMSPPPHTHIYTCIHRNLHTHTQQMYTHTNLHTYTYIHISIHKNAHMYVHIYLHTQTCTHVHTRLHTHSHINTHTQINFFKQQKKIQKKRNFSVCVMK